MPRKYAKSVLALTNSQKRDREETRNDTTAKPFQCGHTDYADEYDNKGIARENACTLLRTEHSRGPVFSSRRVCPTDQA